MRIYSTVIGNNGDIFVGGSFETRVWNGQKFVAISDIAMFDGSSLQCTYCISKIQNRFRFVLLLTLRRDILLGNPLRRIFSLQ